MEFCGVVAMKWWADEMIVVDCWDYCRRPTKYAYRLVCGYKMSKLGGEVD